MVRGLISPAILASLVLLTACKQPERPPAQDEADVQFVPVAVGAAYGVGVSAEFIVSAVAVGGIYALDCTRPVSANEVRFFCDGPTKLGQATVNLIVQSTQTLARVLQWSAANVVSHLAELSKFSSMTHLKSAVGGTSNAQTLSGAVVSPDITSASGKHNFVSALKASIEIKDKSKKSCNFIAQYEARLVPRDYKGGWMGGTSTRFLARGASPESAEAMALTACEWFSGTLYKLAPGFAGYSSGNNDCRKPRLIDNFKEKYRTSDMTCPSVKVCTSEANCKDYM